MARFILLCLLGLQVVVGYAQQLQPYLFSYIGTRRGLVSDDVRMVQQDKQGFIWIATNGGLQRYDGRRFVTMRHSADKLHSIPDEEILDIQMDTSNRLWILNAGNKVGYLNVLNFTYHKASLKMKTDSLQQQTGHFFLDSKGNLMLVLAGHSILTYRASGNEFSGENNPFVLPMGWAPFCIKEDKDQRYWIGCDSGLVGFNTRHKTLSYRSANRENHAVIQMFANNRSVTDVLVDKQGNSWILSSVAGTQQPQLFRYDKKSGKVSNQTLHIQQLKMNAYFEVSGILEQRDGSIWIIGNSMLARYEEENQSFEIIKSNLPGEFSIRYDKVQAMYEDRENSLWACTNRGLYRFNPAAQFFKTLPNKRFQPNVEYNSNVTGVYPLQNGNILINTSGDGLFTYDKHFNPISAAVPKPNLKTPDAVVNCLLERRNADIWLALQNGYLEIYNKDKKQVERIKPSLLNESMVTQLAEDADGNIWLGDNKGQLVKWESATRRFSMMQRLQGTINRLYLDNRANMWVCTSLSGVYRLNAGNGSILSHYQAGGAGGKSLLGNDAVEIKQYNDSLYIIASNGLNVLNILNGRFRYFSKENGLLSNNVSNIIKDRQGCIWVTTKPWVCSINLEKEVVTTYDERDGVYTNTFNPASAALLADGRIAMGASSNIMLFDPAKTVISAHALPPDITITGFSVMNKWQSMDSISQLRYIELTPDQNSITIELSTLTYQTIYGYFYMLEGLDKDWQVSSQQNQITYNYLPPGNYVFKAICKNGNGEPSRNIVALHIKVKPVFWKTWWFYSLVISILAALVYWIDRERMKRKETIQAIRSEIAGNLHQEVNVALSNINILSEMARMKTDSDPVKSKEYIEQIYSKSHDMITAMDDMLWSLSPENDNMQKTIERMKEYIDALQNRHGVHISITVDTNVEALELNMKLRHESLLLFKEGIRSLVQAGARNCEIHLAFAKNNLQFSMQFENRHCDMQQLNNLLHRQDLEKNMRAMNAVFNVQVHKTNSVFSLSIPVV